MVRKSGFVAVIGRPNAGKSTLMNVLCGKKIAIVSHVPQTTRNTIKGIYTKDDTQMVFLDTPGMHESARAYNKVLNRQALDAVGEADVVLYVVDLSRSMGSEEQVIMKMLKDQQKPVVVAYNKIDIKREHVAENSLTYKQAFSELDFRDEAYISAKKGTHIEDLIDALTKVLPEGEFYYPEGMYTDSTIEFMVSEAIRERVMLNMHKEVPHSIKVDTKYIDEESNERVLTIQAEIIVERDSQKGIVIGKGGAMLKKLGIEARKNLEEMFHKKVYLELLVKVDPNWRNG